MLTHGVLLSWDGRVIRHGTSVMERTKHVYGSFFAAKSSVVAYGARMAFRREAIRQRRSRWRRRRQHDVPGGLLNSPKTGGCHDMEDVDLLSIPIARKSKAVGDSVPIAIADVLGNNDVDEAVGNYVLGDDDILGDDDSSWSNHIYADDVNDSTSCDSGMILDLTPGRGNELMGGPVINDVPDGDGTMLESDRVARHSHDDAGFHQGHKHCPPNDRYDSLLNRGQEYPSLNDGKRGWNDFCRADGVAHHPHNGAGFHQGHEHHPLNDRYNSLLNRGQEYPSLNDGKRGWNDFCRADGVAHHPHNGAGFHQGHEHHPLNDRYNSLLNRGQEYPSPNDGKRGWNDFRHADRVAHYPHNNAGFHQGHKHCPPNDRSDSLLNRGQEYPSPNDGKRGWNDFRRAVRVARHPHNNAGFHRGHEDRPPIDRYDNFRTGGVARYPCNDGFDQGHDCRAPNDYVRGGWEYCSPFRSPNDRKRGWHGDWQGIHGDCDPTVEDGITSCDHRQRRGDSMQYRVLQPKYTSSQRKGGIERR